MPFPNVEGPSIPYPSICIHRFVVSQNNSSQEFTTAPGKMDHSTLTIGNGLRMSATTMKRTYRKKPLRPSTLKVSRFSFVDVVGDSHTHYGDVYNWNEMSTHAGIQLKFVLL